MKFSRPIKMVCLSAFVLACLISQCNLAQAAGPSTLNYQGFLTDQKSGVPINTRPGSGLGVTFTIYDANMGGAMLYSETQTLPASNGVINALIGSMTPFPATLTFDKPYWLEVKVGADTLAPRQAIASSAFAQSASSLSGNSRLNLAGGLGALAVNTTGSWNTALGTQALFSNTTGTYNTALGAGSLKMMGSGEGNTAVGDLAGEKLLTGYDNVYLGHYAGPTNSSESSTIRIGYSAIQRAFIAGIRDATLASDNGQPVVVDTSGQLGNVPGITLTTAGLSFGNTTRQMLNLWGTNYGIGVQSNMLYARTASGFGWFQGGVHSDTWNDPGAGGKRLMGLSEQGLRVVGSDPAGANDIVLAADGSIHAKVVNTTSDRNAKENFADIDSRVVLAKVAQLPLHTWNYKGDANTVKHLGPVAQDFQAAFNVGTDDKHIATVDADGVAFAAIQGLYRMVQDKDAALRVQSEQIERLKADRAAMHARVEKLELSTQEKMAELELRIEQLLAQGRTTKIIAVNY